MNEKNKVREKESVKKNDEKERILPQQNTDTSNPQPGSMSEGNLSNNRNGRERTRTPHTKTFITGSDDDGQAT